MFENEIKFISDFTLNKVKELGSFITIDKLMSIDIHPSIKKYVEGEIDYLIYEDRKKLIENSLFDYSGKEISNYFDLIGTEIKKTKKISFEDIKNIILQAVSFNANYVVRPKWSLSKLIFGNNKSVSVNEIQLMFNYTYYYEYLNNVFLAYLSKKKILNVSVTEFELIVNKIDRELFMLHQSKLVDNALYAIADYFSIGGLNKSSVSIESIESFLKEKNLTELLFKLKRGYTNTGKKKADIDEVRKVLYSTLSIDSPFVEESDGNELIPDDKHFDNPLKKEFISDEFVVDAETDQALIDVDKKDNITEDLLQEIRSDDNQELAAENPFEETKQLEDETLPIASDDKIINEPEEFEPQIMVPDEMFEKNNPQKTSEETLPEFDEINTEENPEILLKSDITEDSAGSIKELALTEEELLSNLTEEIEKTSDDEIIILDEKEQEDLLNFYDNELEISIEDDNETNKKDLDLETEIDAEIGELKLEHEIEINDNIEDGVPIEKIDFEKDLVPDEPEEKEEDSNTVSKSIFKKKSEDIFSYLSKKEIDKIIKNLFNSDSEDFANTVEKLSECVSHEEASHILDNVFKYARIKPHSKEAAMLRNAVARYFNVDI